MKTEAIYQATFCDTTIRNKESTEQREDRGGQGRKINFKGRNVQMK